MLKIGKKFYILLYFHNFGFEVKRWQVMHIVPHVSSFRKIMSLYNKAELFGFKVQSVIRPFLLTEIPSVCRQDQLLALCEFSDCKATFTPCDFLWKAYFFRLNSSIFIVNEVQNIITL